MAGRPPGLITRLTHRSALGTWTFHECRPAALASAVESIWEVEGSVTHTRSRIFPNGRVELLVNLGPPQRIVEGTGLSRFDRTCVSGVQPGPLMVDAPDGTHLFGVRVRAEAAGALLAAPMHGLSGRLVELPDVVGRSARRLVDRIVTARSFAERADLVCRWIEDSQSRSRGPSAHVSWTASQIESSGGAAAIEPLRRRAGISAKRLAADFREQVGVTPKFLARLVRFQRAIGLIQGGAPLSDVALGAGYYDQSHLGLDFRELAGITPREFVATVYPDATSAVA